jgi:hypothetical protein
VGWVYAPAISAFMVNVETSRDRADVPFKGDPVRQQAVAG